MQLTMGARVAARGLTWDVLEREVLGEQVRLRLRCVADDLLGLEWDILHPHETVQPLRDELNPNQPAPLAAWRLYHQACLLDQVPGPTEIMIATPGRVNIEPYQLVPLMRALELPRPRLLLADGVGLGKTIEAGLIAAELIARRRAHRILIVAPAGPLLTQWEQEMRYRFGLRFTVLADSAALHEARRKLELGGNPFGTIAFALTSLDFAKQESVLEELERAAWDLVIIDEAHHCVSAATTTSRDDTLRRRLAEVLARQSDGLLLLTATPHDGYDPHFASLIELLDPSLVDGRGGLTGLAYRRHVVRRLKSHLTHHATGQPLFHHRRVTPVPITTEDKAVQAFHRALSALVAPRLTKAARSKTFGDALAFVSLLKRSVSTIGACLNTLRVVADRYAEMADRGEAAAVRRERARTLRAYRRRALRFGVLDARSETDVERLEAEDIAAGLRATGDTEAALRALIRLGEAAEPADPKLMALVTEIHLIRAAEPNANVLVYTEYADSQTAAVRALRAARGIAGHILTIGGQDSEEARTRAAERCAEEHRIILISTDSLAEGLNLQQRCHHLIHLDLPYNPNRLEQRNGRIDRYGQTREPDIRYLCLAGTFEERLLLRLIAKYEKARAQLTFMPDTIGMTAAEDRLGSGLLAGLAEEQASLFPDDKPPIRTLDVAASEAETEAYRDLLHEIDRAYEGFDGMAARHGWFAGQGLGAEAALMRAATQARRAAARHAARIDLADFLAGAGLGDPIAAIGRVHPTVRKAIGQVRQAADTRVSVARGDHAALLMTYVMEVATPRHVGLRQMLAVLLAEHGPPRLLADADDWLHFGNPDQAIAACAAWDQVAACAAWDQVAACDARDQFAACAAWDQFAAWAPARLPDAEATARARMRDLATAFASHHIEALRIERTTLDQWLGRRAGTICGPRLDSGLDLFGGPAAAASWRHAVQPLDRLTGFATDAANAPVDRREANGVAALYRRRVQDQIPLAPPILYPAGMLMLVPA